MKSREEQIKLQRILARINIVADSRTRNIFVKISDSCMFLSGRRLVLFGVIAGIVVIIVLLPAILDSLSGQGITNVKFALSKVQNVGVDVANKTISLKVIFAVLNPTDKALTTSRIDYLLLANDTKLGNGTVSFEDIPLNGRPQLYPEKTVYIPSIFKFTQSVTTSEIYNKLKNDSIATGHTNWSVLGQAQIDSAFTTLPKSFQASLP